MLDELHAALRMLAFAESSKVIGTNCAFKTPLSRKLSLPLAMYLLVAAPVVLPLGGKLARMVRAGLTCG
jgi:hypothetical protein